MLRTQIPRLPAVIAIVTLSLSHLSAPQTFAAGQTAPQKIQITVPAMCCQGCVQKVAAQLYAAPGVSNVEADLASHIVTVTFKPSPKFTLGGLWLAAEKGDGKPSKLVTPQATFTLQRSEQLQLSEPLAQGRYWVVVQQLEFNNGAQSISKHLRMLRGVKNVTLDAASRTFFVESDANVPLSPWGLIAAVEQSGHNPESITGPHGLFTIKRPIEKAARATTTQQTQGAVR